MEKPILKQWVLSNGITCYIYDCVDSDIVDKKQMAYCSVTIRAGALADNDKSGLAHFTEHMLLGSKVDIEKSKFSILGTTSLDRTNYMLQCSLHNLERGLNVLYNIVSKKYLDELLITQIKNDVIVEFFEKQSSGEAKNLEELLKMQGIQKISPVGNIDEIQKFTVSDIVSFWEKKYIPSNIAIAIVGKVNISEIYQYVERIFCNMPQRIGETIVDFTIESKKKKVLPINKFKQNYLLQDRADIYIKSNNYKKSAKQDALELLGIVFVEEFLNTNFKEDIDEAKIFINQFTKIERYIHIVIWLRKENRGKSFRVLKKIKNQLKKLVLFYGSMTDKNNKILEVVLDYVDNVECLNPTEFEILKQLEDCYVYNEKMKTNEEWISIFSKIKESEIYDFLIECLQGPIYIFV